VEAGGEREYVKKSAMILVHDPHHAEVKGAPALAGNGQLSLKVMARACVIIQAANMNPHRQVSAHSPTLCRSHPIKVPLWGRVDQRRITAGETEPPREPRRSGYRGLG